MIKYTVDPIFFSHALKAYAPEKILLQNKITQPFCFEGHLFIGILHTEVKYFPEKLFCRQVQYFSNYKGYAWTPNTLPCNGYDNRIVNCESGSIVIMTNEIILVKEGTVTLSTSEEETNIIIPVVPDVAPIVTGVNLQLTIFDCLR